MFATWTDFRRKFTEEFCPKNEAQMALAKLETSAYYQNRRSMDEYIDEFRDLIDQAGYLEGLAIVTKFRCGLQRDIQDLIAQLPIGRPADDKPEDWYAAALRIAENRSTNATFHGSTKTATPTTWFKTVPTPNSEPRPSFPSAPIPKVTPNPVPMDIDATKRKNANPPVCYRCGEPGHLKPQCPRRFDIRHMTMDEMEEWMQQKVLDQDAAELKETVERRTEEDFVKNDE